jgi:golgi apyrase
VLDVKVEDMVKPEKWRYGIVLDAGSSGTRLYIYRWLHNDLARQDTTNVQTLPELESKDKWTKKVHIGLSTYGETPSLIGEDHLQPLLDHAYDHIPHSLIPQTPIFLLATAGMRLLPQTQQDRVLDSVCHYFRENTEFLIPDCNLHVQIISGETEGLFGWLAANYLIGGFDAPTDHEHGEGHHTYGFLDMGGASAQIAFVPNATEAEKHGNDLKLVRLRRINGSAEEYKVFVTSWLGFGVSEARKLYLENLIQLYEGDGVIELPEPCLPAGVRLSIDSHTILEDSGTSQRHLLGTGNFDACLKQTHPLLRLDVPCEDYPCLVNGVHVPAIDFDVNHFIGISQYWHTTHEIFEMGYDDKAYDFETYQARVHDFCQRDWSSITQDIEDHLYGKKVDLQTAHEVCFRASWLINMLHDGIGVPRIGIEGISSNGTGTANLLENGKQKGYLAPFQAVDEIKSTEVSWTLGKMLLYAASTIPPPDNEIADFLPVGFGSNIPHKPIPPDFVYPSLNHGPPPHDTSPLTEDASSLADKFNNTLFKSDAPHRLPGFIFFLLIVIILTFYLCGRERRARLWSRITPKPYNSPSYTRKHSPSLFQRLTRRFRGSNSGGWDPEAHIPSNTHNQALLSDPADFELDDFSSPDVSDTDINRLSRKNSKSKSKNKKQYSPRLFKQGLGIDRLPTPAVDRTGMVVRTESRESLNLGAGLGGAGNRVGGSRVGSPDRM